MFSRLVWTCLHPSSPHFFRFILGGEPHLALFPLENARVWTAKGQYCFRPCNVFGEKNAFCAPTTSLSGFLIAVCHSLATKICPCHFGDHLRRNASTPWIYIIAKARAWTKRNHITSDHVIYWQKTMNLYKQLVISVLATNLSAEICRSLATPNMPLPLCRSSLATKCLWNPMFLYNSKGSCMDKNTISLQIT